MIERKLKELNAKLVDLSSTLNRLSGTISSQIDFIQYERDLLRKSFKVLEFPKTEVKNNGNSNTN